MAGAVQKTLEAEFRGDTFRGLDGVVYADDGVTPLDLSSVGIRCHFRKNGNLIAELALGRGISIDVGTPGAFSIEPFRLDGFPLGTLSYDVEFELPGGVFRTLIFGTIKILEDQTR